MNSEDIYIPHDAKRKIWRNKQLALKYLAEPNLRLKDLADIFGITSSTACKGIRKFYQREKMVRELVGTRQ